MIPLTAFDLLAAAGLVLLLAAAAWRERLGVSRSLAWLAVRSGGQLLLLGLVLRLLFAVESGWWVAAAAAVMLAVAAREVRRRQPRPLRGRWGYLVGAGAMFVSSFTVTLFALALLLGPSPWWEPRLAVPLLGMVLGNTMNGIALSVERLTESLVREREVIEQRLLLGETREEAASDLRREAARAGLIPILNAMAAAGIVSLPGMMTGQILAGAAPLEAVRYQVLILFLIAAGTGFGVLLAVRVVARRLFDDRHRLRLDRLAA